MRKIKIVGNNTLFGGEAISIAIEVIKSFLPKHQGGFDITNEVYENSLYTVLSVDESFNEADVATICFILGIVIGKEQFNEKK